MKMENKIKIKPLLLPRNNATVRVYTFFCDCQRLLLVIGGHWRRCLGADESTAAVEPDAYADRLPAGE
jgi:hypothetical protein